MTGEEAAPPPSTSRDAHAAIPQVAIAVQILGLLILGGIAALSAHTGNHPDRLLVGIIGGITVGARPETIISVVRKGVGS